jgi:hypothetical protein
MLAMRLCVPSFGALDALDEMRAGGVNRKILERLHTRITLLILPTCVDCRRRRRRFSDLIRLQVRSD